jgi:hypothetical protein
MHWQKFENALVELSTSVLRHSQNSSRELRASLARFWMAGTNYKYEDKCQWKERSRKIPVGIGVERRTFHSSRYCSGNTLPSSSTMLTSRGVTRLSRRAVNSAKKTNSFFCPAQAAPIFSRNFIHSPASQQRSVVRPTLPSLSQQGLCHLLS